MSRQDWQSIYHPTKKEARNSMAKMTQKQDDAYDKKHGIKEGSKRDVKQDKKFGVKDNKKKGKK